MLHAENPASNDNEIVNQVEEKTENMKRPCLYQSY